MPRPLKPIQHGTLHAYTRRKCRCEACREASRAHSRAKYVPRLRSFTTKRRSPHALDNSIVGDLTKPTKSLEAMIGNLTYEQMHCRVLVRDGKPV
jgi:hypothetical protein